MSTISRLVILMFIVAALALAQGTGSMYDPAQQISDAIQAINWSIIRMLMRIFFGVQF